MKTARIFLGPLKGYKIKVDLRAQKAYWLGTYEPEIKSILKKIIKKSDIVYDVGAHLGYFSLMSSVFCGKQGQVFCFEPNPENFEIIQKNIELNKIENIFPVKLAITNKKGKISFQKTNSSSQGHVIGSLGETDFDKKNIIEVKSNTIDNFCLTELNPCPDIIKIDVEGEELNVFKGMRQVLEKVKPIVVCEIHCKKGESYPDFKKKLLHILNSVNYQIVEVGSNDLHSHPWGIIAYSREKEYETDFSKF